MKISKSLFKNLTRCDNFASIYDMYTFRNMHHIKSIYGENTNIIQDIENLSEGIFSEQSENALDIFEHMFDDETGEDLTEATSAQLEALMPYFTKLELVAAQMIKRKFPGNLVYGDNIKQQKKYSFTEGEHEYYCYLDIYNECEDGKIRVFEVKGTTSKKFFKLGKIDKEKELAKDENPKINFLDEELYDSIFIKDLSGVYRLKEETDISIKKELECLISDETYKVSKAYKKYFECRNKLFDRYSDTGKYVYDIAIERYIIEKSLIQENLHNKINDMEFYLVVLNSNYVLDQEINLDIIDYPTDKLGHELTICYDLTNITKEYFSIIENQKDYVVECIERRTIDKSCIGKCCEHKKTTECKFEKICFSKVKHPGNVYEFLERRFVDSETNEKYDIYDIIKNKYYSILDMPLTLINKPKHIIQYNCMLKDEEYFDRELINLAIEDIKYPIYHLDFESFNCPLPRYIGETPYMQSVFQFSLHIEREPGVCDKKFDHYEFLAPDHKDYRRTLCEKMIEYIDLSNGGTVMVYNQTFEKGRLKELAQMFPNLADDLLKIRDAVYDLMYVLYGNKKMFNHLLPNTMSEKEKDERCKVFNYYNNGLHGSFSIKKVLPLFTDLTYSTLTVKNGTEAVLTYSMLPTLTKDEYNRLYLALREYCQQDTWAMVEVLRGLRKKLE